MFSGVWFGICQWLVISLAFQKEANLHLEQFGGLIGNRRNFSMLVTVIWFACVWCIWKARNMKCFQNKDIGIEKMVKDVKVLSWNWLHFKPKSLDYNMFQWSANPRVCLGDTES